MRVDGRTLGEREDEGTGSSRLALVLATVTAPAAARSVREMRG